MSTILPSRKRDRIRSLWSKSASLPNLSVTSNASGIPQSTASHLSDPAQTFLTDAINQLTPHEQLVIKDYVTLQGVEETVQAAFNAARAQKLICENKKWPWSDKADKVILWLDRFKSVGDVVANVDPIHVGLPWAGVRFLLEMVVSDTHQMHALLEGMSLALCMANRLRAYFVFYGKLPIGALTTKNFGNALVAVYAHVLRFLAAAINIYATNTAVRKIQALWQPASLVAFEDQCNKLSIRVDVEANNCDRELYEQDNKDFALWKIELDKTLQRLDGIQQLRSTLDALHAKVDLSKLQTVGQATYNSSEEGQLPKCLDGTRSELLDQISGWADRPDSKRIFWLCGMAGTGKSTISRTIAGRFHGEGRLGASFFFKRGESNRSNASYFFATIVAQLADRIPAMRVPIAEALDKDSLLCDGSLEDQFEKLLLQPLLSLAPTQLPSSGLIIVIDALDECERNMDVRLFLMLLSQDAINNTYKLHMFVTSRPDLPIQLGFRQLNGNIHENVALELVQGPTIARDIRQYLSHRLNEIKEEHNLSLPYEQLPLDWPGKDKFKELVDLAVPLFIFASTVCRYIAQTNPKTGLEIVLQQRKNVALSALGQTYLPTLNQLLSEDSIEARGNMIERFRQLVGPIILLAEPFSAAALHALLQTPFHAMHEILRRLHPVLDIPADKDKPIRLLHLSFRDFLTAEPTHNPFWINEAETHREIAQRCLDRLNHPGVLRHDICDVNKPGSWRSDTSRAHVDQCIPADVAYACSFWPWHFAKGGDQLYDDREAYRFLCEHFLHWLEALSWLGRLSSIIEFLDCLLQLLSKDSECRKVAAFLYDAKRFVLQNRALIDLAPLQVYHSALMFAPLQSIVRNNFEGRYPTLWGMFPNMPSGWNAELMTLEGHQEAVSVVAFSPDGQLVASGSMDSTVRLWNAQTGETIHLLKGHQDTISSVAFSQDGQVASASMDHSVKVWNVATGETTQNFVGKSPIVAVAFLPNGQVASIAEDGLIQLWCTKTGSVAYEFQTTNVRLKETTFSQDGQLVAVAPDPDMIQLWEVTTRRLTSTIDNNDRTIDAIAISLDKNILAVASNGFSLRLCDTHTGEIRQELGWGKNFSAVAFSHDDTIILAAVEMRIQLWNIKTGNQVQSFEGHGSYISALASSPIGGLVASASHNQTVRLWEAQVEPSKETLKSVADTDRVSRLDSSPDGTMIASSHSSTIRLWDVETGKQLQTLTRLSRSFSSLKFSPYSPIVAVGLSDGRIQLWNSRTGQERPMLIGHSDNIVAITFSSNQRLLASASRDSTIKLWDLSSGDLISLEGHLDIVLAVEFSSDGLYVASGSADATLRIWDVQTGQLIQKFQRYVNDSDWISAVSFSPDGQTVASASLGSMIQIWQIKTGAIVKQIPTTRAVQELTFSDDGRVLRIDNATVSLEHLPYTIEDCSQEESLDLDDSGWIIHGHKYLIQLPYEYRGTCQMTLGDTLMIGQRSGEVLFFRLK